MSSAAGVMDRSRDYPVLVQVEPALEQRNRLTTFFRLLLSVPHVILVGGPTVFFLSWGGDNGMNYELGASGLLGAVAAIVSVIAWLAILFTGRHPNGLWDLSVYYLRWRVRAVAYFTLLRDEYPPFGDDEYPASLNLVRPDAPRDRLTVAFRLILAIPHIFVVGLLVCVWVLTTIVAWWAILLTGRYPESLYGFGTGMLRWTTRVEAYLLLLCDEYPPFSLS